MAELPMTLAPPTVAVRETRDARQAESWVLALQSRGIPAVLARVDNVFSLQVPPSWLDVARSELDAVDAEEREARAAVQASVAAEHRERFASRLAPVGGAVFALLLLGFYMVTGPVAEHAVWFGAGASDSVRVLHGEWWRTVTALTLHADSNHVLSNVAFGAVVVTAVMRRTGVGIGGALVVLAGTLGNAANAWAYGAHHNSIGFSTAVFGAVGILGGLTYVSAVRGISAWRRGRPAWTALAGSVALLAMLGASERTDMFAHLFGMVAGLGLGLGVGYARWIPRAAVAQVVAAGATIGLVVGAWMLALANAS